MKSVVIVAACLAAVHGLALGGQQTSFQLKEQVFDPIYEKMEDALQWAGEEANLACVDDDVQGQSRPPHHGRGRRPNPHRKYENVTMYKFLKESKYFTKLAKAVGDDDELLKIFDSTKQNYTFFAPTDKAIHRAAERAKKLKLKEPTKEELREVIKYHVVKGFYPAGRVLRYQTLTSLFTDPDTKLDQPIRISVGLLDRGLSFNFEAHPVFLDIFTSNGVVHAIDSVFYIPPKMPVIFDAVPTAFSTFSQAIEKTGLWEDYDKSDDVLTVFAPTNSAWTTIPPRVTAFLFSPRGTKVLKKLLEYHVVPKNVFYSDSLLKDNENDDVDEENTTGPRRRFYHTELKTALGPVIHVDEITFLRFTDLKLNGRSIVSAPNIVAKDGVVHGLKGLLFPPKTKSGEVVNWDAVTEEELLAWFD